MGRKNRRPDTFEPIDYTGAVIPRPPAAPPQGRRETREEYQIRTDRQRHARINRGIDWGFCLVPGCARTLRRGYGDLAHAPERRDHTLDLPLCFDHRAVLFATTVKHFVRDGQFIEAIADVNDALAARKRREETEAREAHMASQDGDIYFVRVGALVKVGWTRDLYARLKSYGASAELLVSYPATRADETNLHRQLRPALAKGREWYEDGDVIAHFIDEALTKYGMPPTFESLWTKPKRVVAGKRHGGRA